MTSITLELDPVFQEKLEKYASKHGQSVSDSATKLINMGFEIIEEDEFDSDEHDIIENDDLPYNPEFVKDVFERLNELNEGKGVYVTIEELKAMLK